MRDSALQTNTIVVPARQKVIARISYFQRKRQILCLIGWLLFRLQA